MLHVVVNERSGAQGRPVAFVTLGEDGDVASRFGARLIHGSMTEVYDLQSVTIDLHGRDRVWSAWFHEGCPVAWTDDWADQACLGPVIRFGEVGGVSSLQWRYRAAFTYVLRGSPPVNSYAQTVLDALRKATR